MQTPNLCQGGRNASTNISKSLQGESTESLISHVASVARRGKSLGVVGSQLVTIERREMTTVRVSLTEAHINILLNLTSKELLRQITHKAIDPLTAETSMRIVKAKEKFMPERKVENEPDSGLV